MSHKVGVIIVCRYESNRLPGKILREINGQSIISIIIDRIARANQACEVVVATSDEASDDPIAHKCQRLQIPCFRGSLDDVAARFMGAMDFFEFDYGVRVNGDNLFVDYHTLSEAIAIAKTGCFDFITNVPGRSFPVGMSVEILRRDFYRSCYKEFAGAREHCEHVTSWLYNNSVGSRHVLVNESVPESSGLKLAIDSLEDFKLAQNIINATPNKNPMLDHRQILQSVKSLNVKDPWSGESGPLLISEIGGNHEGDFEYAKQLIQLAIDCGSDCVKLQLYTGDTLVSPVESEARNRHFKRFELTKSQHIELAEMCRLAGVMYMASVWDLDMLTWIDDYMPVYKIGSGDLTAWPVLKKMAENGKPILLSTGLSNMDEIGETIAYLRGVNPVYFDAENLCVLQCTSMYPIPDDEANLSVMRSIADRYEVRVGYSDHTVGSQALLDAATLGAVALEFHFTDNREDRDFRDHAVSLLPEEVIDLKAMITKLKKRSGDGIKVPQRSEMESGHVISFRRGAYLRRDLPAGSVVAEDDLIYLRPLHGVDARDASIMIGKQAAKDLKAFTALSLELDFLV